MANVRCYRDLEVWQCAVDLAVATYEITQTYPRSELFGLTAYTRKTGVSIPSNIAEGQPLRNASYINHLIIAKGGCGELDTQFEVARRLTFLKASDWRTAQKMITRTSQLLSGLTRSLGHRW